MAVKELEIRIKASDDASPIFKRVADNLDRTADRAAKAQERMMADIGDANFAKMKRGSKAAPSFLKQAGEAGKSEGVAKIGDIFDRTAGLTGGAGALAKGFGAALIVGQATALLERSAVKISELGDVIRDVNSTPLEIAGKAARAIPIVGDLATAFDHVGEAIGDIAFGRESVDKITADAAKIDQKIAEVTRRRKLVIDVIQNFSDQRDPTAGIERERAKAIGDVKSLGSQLNPEQAAAAIDIANKAADEKLRQLRANFRDEIAGINEITRDAFRQIEVAGADDADKAFRVKLAGIDAAVAKRKADIDRTIADVKGSNAPDADKRIKVSALEDQRGAVERAGGAERQRATTDADKAKADAAKARAADVGRITREALQTEIGLGDEAAKIQGAKLETAQRYADKLDAINEKLKDANLTPDQRQRLVSARDGLAGQAERDVARLDAPDRGGTVVEQGQRFASAVDGRFNRDSVAAKSAVDVYRDQAAAQKKTADNTAETAKATRDAAAATRELLAYLKSAPTI